MTSKTKFARFNDGVVTICREKVQRTGFAARENPRGVEDLTFVCKLAFEQMSKRQQDQEFAEQNGFSLSMKIRTRAVAGIDSKCKAIIGGFLYDVSHIDKTRTEFFLFLEEVRQIDT